MYTHVLCTCTCTCININFGDFIFLLVSFLCLYLSTLLFLPYTTSLSPSLFPFSLFPLLFLSLSLSRFTKPRQFAKSDNNGSESPPGERRSFSNKRSSFVMSAGAGGRRRSFSLRVEEQRRNEAEGFQLLK